MTSKATTASKKPADSAESKTGSVSLTTVLSLIFSLGGFLIFGIAASVAGIVVGHIAIHNIAKNHEGGRGIAVVALVVGYAQIALAVLGLFASLVFLWFGLLGGWHLGFGGYSADMD